MQAARPEASRDSAANADSRDHAASEQPCDRPLGYAIKLVLSRHDESTSIVLADPCSTPLHTNPFLDARLQQSA
jgi:hypothetical protein